jgi:hypothetical protein
VPQPLRGVPATPMLVVYWARWADAKGATGRFCPTVTARVEGWGEARTGRGEGADREDEVALTRAAT